MSPPESGRQDTATDPYGVAEAIGRGPLAVVLLDPEGEAVWANEVVRRLADSEDRDTDRATGRLLRALVAATTAATPSARSARAQLPADRGLLDRELWIAPVGDGYRVVTFHPDRAAGDTPVEHAGRLDAMLQHTHDLVTVVDANGKVILSNAAAGRLSGFSGGSVNGSDAFELIHPDDRERAVAAFLEVLATPGVHPTIALRVRFADGTYHDVEAVPSNQVDVPGVEGIVVTMQDVTARKRAEAEAAKSQAYLQSLIENLRDVIVVLDDSFQVIWTSPALARIIEAPVETNLGQSAFNDIHPDDLGGVLDALTGLAAGPLGEQVRVELRLEARPGSGRWRWIEATAVNRLADPHVGGIVCTLRDVTEEKAAAAELQAAFERERRAAERLRELDVLKDQFLASVSHEMRTPLAIIIGFADLLAKPDAGAAVHAEALERIRGSATEMRAMVENLLDYSELEAGKLVVRLRSVPLRRSIEATIGTVRALLTEHPVTIDVPEELAVLADPDGLDRVLRNLLANAAKYSSPGRPIVVRAAAEASGSGEGQVVIDVVDEGVGIPADQLGLVFERLYRAPGAAFVARGTGVGLNMVRRYAELMGGSVSVRSVVGEGSTFTVRLPVG
jgi:PAS domain S-box-containing protein